MHGRSAILALVLWAAVVSLALAARTWTDDTGRHKIEGEFVELRGGKVRIKRTDGKTVHIPLGRLSDADQEFVRTRLTTAEAPAVPELGPEGQAVSDELVKLVQANLAGLAEQPEIDPQLLIARAADQMELVLERSQELVRLENDPAAMVPVLIRLLEDSNFAVRAAGVVSLRQIGVKAAAALPTLLRLLSDPYEPLRDDAREALAEIGRDAPAALLPGLVRLLREGDAAAAAFAADVLPRLGPATRPLVGDLTRLAADQGEPPHVRASAALAMRDIIIRWLTQYEPEDEALERSGVTHEERMAPLREHLEALAELTGDDLPEVRGSACIALARIDEQALGKLPPATVVRLLKDGNYDVRQSLVSYFQFGGQESARLPIDGIVELLAVDDREVRELAMRLLVGVGPRARQAVPALLGLLRHEDNQVRAQAIGCLGSIDFSTPADPETLPAIKVRVASGGKGNLGSIEVEDRPVKDLVAMARAVTAFAEEHPRDESRHVEGQLAAMLDDASGDVQLSAAYALATIGSVEAVRILRDARDNALRRDVREAAENGLRQHEEIQRQIEQQTSGEPAAGEDPFDEDAADSEDGPSADHDHVAVELSLADNLGAEHVRGIWLALAETGVGGIKLVGKTGEPQRPWRINLWIVPRPLPASPYRIKVRLESAAGKPTVLHVSRFQEPEKAVRDFAVLQYVTEEAVREFSGHGYYDFRAPLISLRHEIGRGALPLSAEIVCDKRLPYLQLVKAVDAVSASYDESGAAAPMVQHVILKVGDQRALRCFILPAVPYHPPGDP